MTKTKIKTPHEVHQEQAVNLEPLCEELRQAINKTLISAEAVGRESYIVAVDKFPRGVIAIVKGECQSAGWLVSEQTGSQHNSYHSLVLTEGHSTPDYRQ